VPEAHTPDYQEEQWHNGDTKFELMEFYGVVL
jgi:hypothetical protein